jgi:hypothetical protein
LATALHAELKEPFDSGKCMMQTEVKKSHGTMQLRRSTIFFTAFVVTKGLCSG